MRRIVVLALLLLVPLCCLCGCEAEEEQPIDAVGKWVCDTSGAFYFELYEDNTCIMFNRNDEWVSEGTYEVDTDQIEFSMDTGDFNWSRREEGMVFESSGEVLVYHKAE